MRFDGILDLYDLFEVTFHELLLINYRAIAHSEEPTNQVVDLDPRHTNSITGGTYNDINVPLRKKQRRLVRDNPGGLKALAKAR